MRVLQINSVCGVGSTGRIATDIHAILTENDHESNIAFGRGNPLYCDKTIRISNKLDNYLHVAKTRFLDQHGFGSRKATKEFISTVKELDPDVIHLHNIHGYYINVELLFEYLKESNKPVIWTLHDCWPFTGHCTNFEYVGCDCWKIGGSHKCIQKRNYPSSLLINNSRNNFERKKRAFTEVRNLTLVTPSNWLAILARQSFLSEYPIKIINNGIDLEIFKPTQSEFREKYNIKNKFIILGIANVWGERKGYNYFIDLSKKLDKDEVIVLVGLGEKQLKKIPPNIIGITRTNNIQELAEIYSTADVFVNPTLEDNFPTTNIESLACGVPVITFNTGGSVEIIDEKCGYIVEKGNLVDLLEKIRLVKDKGKTNYFNSCLERTKRLYNKNDRFRDYINLYNRVAD